MNNWIAYWFTFFTPHIPTPDIWQMWCEEAYRSNVLPHTPGW